MKKLLTGDNLNSRYQQLLKRMTVNKWYENNGNTKLGYITNQQKFNERVKIELLQTLGSYNHSNNQTEY